MANVKIIVIGAKVVKKLAKEAVVIAGPVVAKEAKKMLDKEAPELIEKGKNKVLNMKQPKAKPRPGIKKLNGKRNTFRYDMRTLNKLFEEEKIDSALFNYLSDQIVQYVDVLSYDNKTFEKIFSSLIDRNSANEHQRIIEKYEFTRDKTLEYLNNKKTNE